MNVYDKICGIGDDIVGAPSSARQKELASYVPRSSANPYGTRTAYVPISPGAMAANARTGTSRSGTTATTPYGAPMAPFAPGPNYGPGPSMSPFAPPLPGANPYNTPGLPGYNPALPPNTSTMAAAYNAQNPYNVPGLPGYNPYQPTNPVSGYNTQNPYNAPGIPGYNPYQPSPQQGYQPSYPNPSSYGGYADYNAPTAADYGLPSPDSSGYSAGGYGGSPDLSYAFNDPSEMNAIDSYFDPMSQLGPWSY